MRRKENQNSVQMFSKIGLILPAEFFNPLNDHQNLSINNKFLFAELSLEVMNLPTYVVLSRLTGKGRETVKDNPERIKEVNDELEEMGAEVVDQYAVFGRFDFVNILEVPDEETMAQISVEMGSRGSVMLETLQAVEIDDLIESV